LPKVKSHHQWDSSLLQRTKISIFYLLGTSRNLPRNDDQKNIWQNEKQARSNHQSS
jgi:hypothetical protein